MQHACAAPSTQQPFGYGPSSLTSHGLLSLNSWASGPTPCMQQQPTTWADVAPHHQQALQQALSFARALAGTVADEAGRRRKQQASPLYQAAVSAPATWSCPTVSAVPPTSTHPPAAAPRPMLPSSWPCTAAAAPAATAAEQSCWSATPSVLYQVTFGCWGRPQPARMQPPHRPLNPEAAATPAVALPPAGRRTLAFKTDQTRGILTPRVSRRAPPLSGVAALLAAAECCAHDAFGLPPCTGHGGPSGVADAADLAATYGNGTGAARKSRRAAKPSERRFCGDDKEAALPPRAGGSLGGSGGSDPMAVDGDNDAAHACNGGAVRKSSRAAKPSKRRFCDDDDQEAAGLPPRAGGGSSGGSAVSDQTAADDSNAAHTYAGATRKSGRAARPSKRRRFQDDDDEEEAGQPAPKAAVPKAKARVRKPKQEVQPGQPPLSEQRQARILAWAERQGPDFIFVERTVRLVFGDNADISKALRELVNKGKITKDESTKGGRGTPFIYWVTRVD